MKAMHLPESIRCAVRYEGGVNRRLFLSYGAALSSLPLLSRSTWANPRPVFNQDPFTLGVASGDPDARGMVLWTRLAPQPLEPFGGMPNESVEVHWVVAEDEALRQVVASGKAIASPQLGHSVHVEVEALEPDRWYWYRFTAGEAVSPVGRTRTMPATDVMPEKLKFAFASCQNYVRCTLTPESWVSDYVAVSDVLELGGTCSTRASFVVEAGRPGAQPV